MKAYRAGVARERAVLFFLSLEEVRLLLFFILLTSLGTRLATQGLAQSAYQGGSLE